MGEIIIENIQMYGYHGCMVEEGKIGSDYRLDVKIKTDLSKPGRTDKLSDTIDYVVLHSIIKEEMSVRSKLLEHVANRILEKIFNSFSKIKKAHVKISKIAPPIGGNVEFVAIKMKKIKKG